MSLPIKLISTDFDGTLFAEFENPPVPVKLQKLIGDLQAQGVIWVINTGRDLSGLMEALGRSQLSVKPDYLCWWNAKSIATKIRNTSSWQIGTSPVVTRMLNYFCGFARMCRN